MVDQQSEWGNYRSHVVEPRRRSRTLVFLACSVVALVAALGAAYDNGYDIRTIKSALISAGVVHQDHDFSALYQTYKMKPLPVAAEQTSGVYDNLVRLEVERCDKEAIYAATNKLTEMSQRRASVDLLLGFASQCHDNEGERRVATDNLLMLGDYEQALSQARRLTAMRPELPDYRYRVARAEAGLGRTDDALQDYATTIKLSADQHQIGQWVFTEMSQMYAVQQRYCEAITPLQTYVSLDPASRDNAQMNTLMSNYSSRGSCSSYSKGGDSFAVLTNDVIPVKVLINGVPGTFALDTGASFVAVTETFARRAGVDSSDDGIVNTMTANGASTGKLATATTISVGHASADAVPVLVQPKTMGRLDGLLGRSFLSRFDLSIEGHRWTLKAKRDAEQVAQSDGTPDQRLRMGRSVAQDIRQIRRYR